MLIYSMVSYSISGTLYHGARERCYYLQDSVSESPVLQRTGRGNCCSTSFALLKLSNPGTLSLSSDSLIFEMA